MVLQTSDERGALMICFDFVIEGKFFRLSSLVFRLKKLYLAHV